MSTRTPLDSSAIQVGHDTAALAGLLTQTYGFGLVEALRALLGPDGTLVATQLLADVDQAVAHLDPDWYDHAT